MTSDLPEKLSAETDELNDYNIEVDRSNLYALINNTNDLMWSVDTNYKLITSNNAFNEMVKAMSGKTIKRGGEVLATGFTKEQITRFRELYDRAFSGEIFAVTEFTETPVKFWSELSFHPILNGAETVGTACFAHDITKRKLTEEKIVKTQRLYEFISQINQAISHTTDEQTLFRKACNIAVNNGKFGLAWIGIPDVVNRKINVVAYNDKACTTDIAALDELEFDESGPTASALRNGECFVINDFENRPANSTSAIFATKRGYRSLMVLPITKLGTPIATFNLLSTHVDLFDDQEVRLLKEAAGDISFALDVFEKDKHGDKMKDEIIHNELRLKQAQYVAHLGSWELNFSTGAGLWSEEACRIYGMPPEDNIHSFQSWVSYVHPEDLDHVLKVIKESERTLSSSAFHHRIILKNGEIKYIFSEAHFEFDKEGKPVGLYGIGQDVTKAKKLENERDKILADILQRNNDLEQFSYIVSHNLRAPVANIIGLSDLLQSMEDDHDESKLLVGELFNSAQKLDTVIKDLSRILQVKHQVNEKSESVDFAELVNDIQSSIIHLLKGKDVKIICDFSVVDQMVTIKSYLYSIFFNLISNSIKYHRPNIPPVIEISSHKRPKGIKLMFKDNGLGIDLRHNGSKVFGLYKRFHAHVEGKGMGLFIVKTQVEKLGGKIAIESEVNKGTTFKIVFGSTGP